MSLKGITSFQQAQRELLNSKINEAKAIADSKMSLEKKASAQVRIKNDMILIQAAYKKGAKLTPDEGRWAIQKGNFVEPTLEAIEIEEVEVEEKSVSKKKKK
jgi:hypothetical protein